MNQKYQKGGLGQHPGRDIHTTDRQHAHFVFYFIFLVERVCEFRIQEFYMQCLFFFFFALQIYICMFRENPP